MGNDTPFLGGIGDIFSWLGSGAHQVQQGADNVGFFLTGDPFGSEAVAQAAASKPTMTTDGAGIAPSTDWYARVGTWVQGHPVESVLGVVAAVFVLKNL